MNNVQKHNNKKEEQKDGTCNRVEAGEMYMQKLCRNTRKENTNSGDLDIIGVTL
jgi:hypothetical protein